MYLIQLGWLETSPRDLMSPYPQLWGYKCVLQFQDSFFSVCILWIWTKFVVLLRKAFYCLNHLSSPPSFFLIKIILCSLFTYILIWLSLSLWRILTIDASSDSHWRQWVNKASLQWVIVIGNQSVHFSLRPFRDIQGKQCRADNKAISYNSSVDNILGKNNKYCLRPNKKRNRRKSSTKWKS